MPDMVEPPAPWEIAQAAAMMRAANGGTLAIRPLPPMPVPPPSPGPLGDPQSDFLLAALGLGHVWTVPAAAAGFYPPMAGGAMFVPPPPVPPPPMPPGPAPAPGPAPGPAADGGGCDPNELSIDDL